MREAGSVLERGPDSVRVLVERRMWTELFDIVDNTNHPLHHILKEWSSCYSEWQTCTALKGWTPQEVLHACNHESVQRLNGGQGSLTKAIQWVLTHSFPWSCPAPPPPSIRLTLLFFYWQFFFMVLCIICLLMVYILCVLWATEHIEFPERD